MGGIKLSDIFKSFGFLTGKVEQMLEEDFIEQLKPYGINARQFGVLIRIKERPNTSQKEIAEDLKIDRTSMVDHVDRLESLHYINRDKNSNDRRSYCLNLTEKGKKTVDDCLELMNQSEREVLSALEDEEKDAFKKYLIKIVKRIGEK